MMTTVQQTQKGGGGYFVAITTGDIIFTRIQTWKVSPSQIFIFITVNALQTKVTTVPITAQGVDGHLTNSAQSLLSLIFLAR